MTEQPLDELERRRAELYARLAGTGDFRPGSVSETWRRCGKPNCACAQPGHARSRAAVPVDPFGGRQDALPAAGRRRPGQGAPRDSELQAVRGGDGADRGGERGDLRGQAGLCQPRRRRRWRRPSCGRGEGGFRERARREALSAEVGRASRGSRPGAGLRCGAGGGGGGDPRRDAQARRRRAGKSCWPPTPATAGRGLTAGQGHQAGFVAYRDQAIDAVLGPVTLTRAWYHCAACGHGLAPGDAEWRPRASAAACAPPSSATAPPGSGASPDRPEATQIVDIWHAREHLHDLARLLEFMLGDQREDWLAARLDDLDHGDIDAICAAARVYPLLGSKKDELRTALGYFENNAPRMRYKWFRSRGLFTGSGVVKGRLQSGHRPAPEIIRHEMDGQRGRSHRHPALPSSHLPRRPHLAATPLPDRYRLIGISAGTRRIASRLPVSHLQNCPAPCPTTQ